MLSILQLMGSPIDPAALTAEFPKLDASACVADEAIVPRLQQCLRKRSSIGKIVRICAHKKTCAIWIKQHIRRAINCAPDRCALLQEAAPTAPTAAAHSLYHLERQQGLA
jgi:hypothetical protein